MYTARTIGDLRSRLRDWQRAGQRVAFVPTMGNLHAGHLKLVSAAQQQADKVIVSIFVNPTQFGPNEDYALYPRTESQDCVKLVDAGVDALFLPSAAEMYPNPPQTSIKVASLSAGLCGAFRPGHFDGVALVVCKLLNIVQPDVLLLGEKDFQQLAVVRRMVADLNLPVTVTGIPTVREADGLAMSSRNAYLTEQNRSLAPMLYQSLCDCQTRIIRGERSFQTLAAQKRQFLLEHGFAVEYFEICRADDLLPATANDRDLVILTAARLGATRLIDNIYLRVE